MTRILGSSIHIYLPTSKNNPLKAENAVLAPPSTPTVTETPERILMRHDGARYKWIKSFKGFAVAKKDRTGNLNRPQTAVSDGKGVGNGDTAENNAINLDNLVETPIATKLAGTSTQRIASLSEAIEAGAVTTLTDLLQHPGKTYSGSSRLKQDLQRIVTTYDENVLKTSPIVDAKGSPFKLALAPGSGPKRVANQAYSPNDLDNHVRVDDVAAWINNYSEKRAWQDKHMQVRKIDVADVPSHESALAGQDGVFCQRKIGKGAIVGPFGGVILDNGAEAKHRKICEVAGTDPDRYRFLATPSGNTDRKLIGQSVLMKANTALLETPVKKGRFSVNEHDAGRNNTTLFFMDVCNQDTNEIIALGFCMRTATSSRASRSVIPTVASMN